MSNYSIVANKDTVEGGPEKSMYVENKGAIVEAWLLDTAAADTVTADAARAGCLLAAGGSGEQ